MLNMVDSYLMVCDSFDYTYEAYIPPFDSQLQIIHLSKDEMIST